MIGGIKVYHKSYMKILIIGKGSFIGGSFINQYNEQYEIDELDLLNTSLKDCSFSSYHVVIHLAAIVHVHAKISKEDYFKVNSDLAVQVAKKAKEEGVGKFIFFSSVKVFGEQNTIDTPWCESAGCKPKTYYGQSKLHAELCLQNLTNSNFIVSIIRPCLVYGPGVKANMYNLIRIIDKSPVLPFGGIENLRSFVYINNLLDLLNAILLSEKAHLIIATDNRAIGTSELCQLIMTSLNKKCYLFSLPKCIRKYFSKSRNSYLSAVWGTFVVDSKIGYESLKYIPRFTVEDGIKDMVNWYLSNKR